MVAAIVTGANLHGGWSLLTLSTSSVQIVLLPKREKTGQLLHRVGVIVHSQINHPVVETPIASVASNYEERGRLPTTPIAARAVALIECAKKPIHQLARRRLKGSEHSVDHLWSREYVPLTGARLPNTPPGPVRASRSGIGSCAAPTINHSELALVAPRVGYG
jgi:hypothetical protein